MNPSVDILNNVIFIVLFTVAFGRAERTVARVLRQAGPLLLAATGGLVHVLFHVVTAAYPMVPVYLTTPVILIKLMISLVEMSIWAMGGKFLWFSGATLPSLMPALSSPVGAISTSHEPKGRWVDKVADWHNRQPAPRAVRVTAGLLFAAPILAVIHLYRDAGVSVVAALVAALYAVTVARVRRPS